jgi:hypothetical protein
MMMKKEKKRKRENEMDMYNNKKEKKKEGSFGFSVFEKEKVPLLYRDHHSYSLLPLSSISSSFILFKTDFPHHDPCPLNYS